MQTENEFDFVAVLKTALVGGTILLYISLVGMVASFANRDIIYQTLSLSFALILVNNFIFGYLTAYRTSHNNIAYGIGGGIITGLVATMMLAVLVLVTEPLNLRRVLVNASPALVEVLTFENEVILNGLITLILWGMLSSLLGAIIYLIPPLPRRAILAGLIGILIIGTLQDLVVDVLTNSLELFSLDAVADVIDDFLFERKGLSIGGTVTVFILLGLGFGLWGWQQEEIKTNFANLPNSTQMGSKLFLLALIGLIMAFLPRLVGPYLSEIVVSVAIYILMGFGLNIVVGFAGLLDLGYVAFFAIGAYTMGLLTSAQLPQTTEFASGFGWTFWQALPVAVGVSVLWGIVLGVPVLRMRGDYLAIVTLGFGEIIRVLALSNFLQPTMGGAQGILGIEKPSIYWGLADTPIFTFNTIELATSKELYYLVIGACIFAAFVSWRLRDSRAGRSWMALREDEDVAEAMGINLIKTKLLAFATGAAFSGLAGAIFATKLGSIYPHSFNLLISVNVLSLIIVGGIGSLPGVIVGGIVLVGLPELLREFSEFRLLIFGALLVTMMLVKPEGFWPAEAQKRELHVNEEAV